MRGFFSFYRRLQYGTWEFCPIFYVELFSICFPVPCSTKYKWYLFFFRPFCVSIRNLNCRKLKSFLQTHSQDHTYWVRHANKARNGSKRTIEMNEHLWCSALISYHKSFELFHLDSRCFCRSYVIIIFFFQSVVFSPNIRAKKNNCILNQRNWYIAETQMVYSTHRSCLASFIASNKRIFLPLLWCADAKTMILKLSLFDQRFEMFHRMCVAYAWAWHRSKYYLWITAFFSKATFPSLDYIQFIKRSYLTNNR